MIPVRLWLKNFLSYGEESPPLDFTSFHVACLVGNNGHGKSSLLDAITWALWGEARKASGLKKPDEGLLRMGARSMQVEFEFDLEGDRYRVLRSYQKGGREGRSGLELQIYNDGGYTSLTQPTLRSTQERINQILSMDYDTFINSAFIVQGRADEFSRKTPRERKTILTEILGLSRYDQLCDLARSRAKAAGERAADCQGRLGQIEAELAHKGEYERGLERLAEKIAGMESELEEREQELAALRMTRAELSAKAAQAEELKLRAAGLGKEIAELQRQAEGQRGQLEALEKVLSRREAILSDYERCQALSLRERDCTERLGGLLDLRARRGRCEQAVQAARHQVEMGLRSWETRREESRAAIEEASQTLKREAQIDQGYRELEAARRAEGEWEERRGRMEELEAAAQKLERAIERATHELDFALKDLAGRAQELKARADLEPKSGDDLGKARAALERLQRLEGEREGVRGEGEALGLEIERTKSRLQGAEREREEANRKLEVLQASPEAQCPLCQTELDEARKGALVEGLAAAIHQSSEEIAELQSALGSKEQARERLRSHYRQLEGELKLLPAAQKALLQMERNYQESLDAAEELRRIQGQIEERSRQLSERAFALPEHQQWAELRREIDHVGYDRKDHQAIRKACKDLQRFEREKAALETAHLQSRRAAEALKEIEARIGEQREILEGERYAEAERAEMKRLEEEIATAGYDELLHRQIREELAGALAEAPRLKGQLEEAEQRVGPARETLASLMASLVDKQRERSEQALTLQLLEQHAQALKGLDPQIVSLEGRLKSSRKAHEEILLERGALQARYDRSLQLEGEGRDLQAELRRADRDREIYEQLAVAFGKDGIQALIIENAIPEIEEEANAILSRLTDHRTHISIEPLRDLKSGGIKETLEIKISDEMGTRDHQLYSGGESFRTDFSLRIALSKLLAQRAGTRLRTLVIDEGFGTQDAEGLERLVEAIQAISEDFDKILVVTHLESLKNSFPVRIEVTKSPEWGSSFRVIQ